MLSSLSALSPQIFAKQEFGGCQLGDPRRVRRLLTIAEAIATRPGESICSLFSGGYAMNGAYEFFKQDYAAPDMVQAGHRQRVRDRSSSPGTYLLLEDTSDISYSGRAPISGLAPIGDGASHLTQGFELHSVISVQVPDGGLAAEGTRHGPVGICGLMHQQYALRPVRERGKRAQRAAREHPADLATNLWPNAVEAIGPPPCGVKWVYVADRGADLYEYFQAVQGTGASFVVRAMHSRRLRDEQSGKTCGTLFEKLEEVTEAGTFTVDIRARPGKAARVATLSVASMSDVLIQAPFRPGVGRKSGEPLRMNVVRVWEQAPAEGEQGLEWYLLTDLPVDTFAKALEASLIYSCRWIVEEFHKALKSGVGAEDLQLEDGKRLMAAVAIMSIVALRLVDMRECARLIPSEPAHRAGFDEVDLEILRRRHKSPITTVREAVRAVARLGGFPGRKGDGEPGMKVLWKGTRYLATLKEGFLLARQSTHGSSGTG